MAEGTRAGTGAPGVKKRSGLFYGWWIVAAGAAINVYGSGLWFYGFPIFFKALLVEFGWARALGAAVVSLSRLEGGLEGPIIGWLIDKYGPRKMAVIGAILFGIGLMLMSFVNDISVGSVGISAIVLFFFLYAGVMAVGHNTGFGHSSMAAINGWFITKRSRAFALYSLGAGGSGLTVMLLGMAVQNFGWRSAAFIGGMGVFFIIIPLSLVLRQRPEQYGYLPDGAEPADEETPKEGAAVVTDAAPASAHSEEAPKGPRSMKVNWPDYDFTIRETFLTVAFWMLVLGFSARSVTMTSVVVHEVAYLTDVGISYTQASGALGMMVFISLIGRLGFGWLGDYVDKRYLFISTYILQALGILILDRVTGLTTVWVFVVVYGISYGGAIPLSFSIVGEYYGRKNYATIRGFMQFLLIPTTVVGPVYAGLVFDVTGSYHVAFLSFVFALLVGIVFIFFARRPMPPAHAAWEGVTPVS